MKKTDSISKKNFDILIKQNLIATGTPEEDFLYVINDDRKYPEYYSANGFSNFVNDMKNNYPEHFRKFSGDKGVTENKGGVGGELIVKNSKYGLMPPKMASVASSSRFCYLALRNGTNALIKDKTISRNNIEFEKECRIFSDGLSAPQLDAFVSDNNCNIYIEAKCHEIFDNHKATFKNKYYKYFKDDKSLCEALYGIEKGKNSFTIPLTVFDIKKKTTRFDIKQLVCHLLGIANQNKGVESELVYIFFKPIAEKEEQKRQLDNVFKELSEEIKSIFTCKVIGDFCKNNKIKLKAIAENTKVMEQLGNENVIVIYEHEDRK